MISLYASPINRPPVGARAEARRQVPGLSQPPDRPSRQPSPACRRRPRRLLLPQPVTLPMWCEVSDSRIPAREQGLGAAIVCSSLFPSRPERGIRAARRGRVRQATAGAWLLLCQAGLAEGFDQRADGNSRVHFCHRWRSRAHFCNRSWTRPSQHAVAEAWAPGVAADTSTPGSRVAGWPRDCSARASHLWPFSCPPPLP